MTKVWYYKPAPIETQQERREIVQRIMGSHVDAAEHMRKQREIEAKRKAAAKQGVRSKVAGYLKAEAKHAMQGPAPAAVVEERIRACMACPGRVDVFNGVKDEGGVGFCTKCGCPANQRSQLSVKLTMAGVACPLGKFKAVEGTGGSAQSALEAAKGVVTSVVAQLRKALS
jgi:hypothetical protein